MPSPQRRSPGVSAVEDLWTKADGSPSSRHGRGRRWRVTVTPPDGDRYSMAFDRKTDAVSWAADQTTKLGLGTAVNPAHGRITLGEIYKEWTAQQGHVEAGSLAKRESAWNARVEARWAGVAVADIKPSHIRTWVAELVKEGRSASTIESAMEVLRPVLDLAVENRRIAVNPAKGIKLPKRGHVDRGYMSHAQLETLAAEFARANDRTWTRFQGYTGLRPEEANALRVSSFDMLRRRVNVREAVTEVRGKLVWKTPKTWEKRSVPFPAFLADELAVLMQGKGRDDLVFTAPAGGVMRLNTWRSRTWNTTLKRVLEANAERREKERKKGGDKAVVTPEFPVVVPYSLRHTAVSLSISAGANVLAVQRMLGHKDASVTLKEYADLFPDDLEAVSGKLDDARRAALAPKTEEGTEADAR